VHFTGGRQIGLTSGVCVRSASVVDQTILSMQKTHHKSSNSYHKGEKRDFGLVVLMGASTVVASRQHVMSEQD
jgi:hypothetical protein